MPFLTRFLLFVGIALALGLGIGILAAYKQNTWIDHSANGIAMLGIAVPNFVLGPVLVTAKSALGPTMPPVNVTGLEAIPLATTVNE